MIQAAFEDSAREQLLSFFNRRFSNKTLKEDQYLHHVTLFFSRKPVEIESDETASAINNWAAEGEYVFVYLEDLVWSDTLGVEAVIVTLKNQNGEILPSPTNKIWHITVSTDGKPPVESNTLLSGRNDPGMRAESQSLNSIKTIAKIVHI
jgi:hypothetical protein